MFDQNSSRRPGDEAAKPVANVTASASDESAKQSALAQADALRGDETAAIAFIMQCGYADARLRAAEHVHDRRLMEQVLLAMRKLDRRVSKLMQGRIDAIVKQEMIALHARECIADAQRLLQEHPLVPNRVAEIDRNWRSIGEVSGTQQQEFHVLRRAMDDRLSAQITLQRSVMDLLENLRKLKGRIATLSTNEVEETMGELERQMAGYRSSPDAASLPRAMLSEFDQVLENLKGSQIHATEAPPGEITKTQALQESLSSQEQERHPQADPVAQAEAQEKFENALEVMAQALQSGTLQTAARQESIIQSMSAKKLRMTDSQAARLSHLRTDLKRLRGWARWSGKVSREELIREVEALPERVLPLGELARGIAASRERWKAMDAATGAAGKSMWERFDAACETAYAPVAEHSRKMALERQQNGARAESLLTQLRQLSESMQTCENLRALANARRSVLQGWERLGHMDRKLRKRLNSEFETLMQGVTAPLRAYWQAEIENREQMIREASQIVATDRRATEQIRALQLRWQQSAKSMPLERADEQGLWNRFRGACDGVFAQRKEVHAAADAQRQRNAAERNAICEKLELTIVGEMADVRRLIAEAEASWSRAGPSPRALEKKIEARFRNAVSALRAKLESLRKAERQSQQKTLLDKLEMCEAIEERLAAGHVSDEGGIAKWEQMPILPAAFEKPMRARFDAACKALDRGDTAYAELLLKNRERFQRDLLRMEIQVGVESPEVLAPQKRQLQVEALRASLSGQRRVEPPPTLEGLCGLPALTDKESGRRLRRLLRRM